MSQFDINLLVNYWCKTKSTSAGKRQQSKRGQREIYQTLKIKGMYYMPPESQSSYDFVYDIIVAKKKMSYHACENVHAKIKDVIMTLFHK